MPRIQYNNQRGRISPTLFVGEQISQRYFVAFNFCARRLQKKMEHLPHPPESADAMEGKKGRKSKIEKNIHMRFFTEVKTFLERKKENTREGEGMLSKKHKL